MADEPAWQIAHRIARCVRGCATDEQWQELTAGIEAEITRLRSQGERAAVIESVTVLGEVMEWIDNWSPNFTEDDEWPATRDRARALLPRGGR